MMRFAFPVLMSTLLLLPSWASAARKPDGKGHVVHTRLMPVLMHKAVPPFKGTHIYEPENSRSTR